MMLGDEVAFDFAIAKAGLIMISSLAILLYLVRLAAKVTFRQSEDMRAPGPAVSKPVAFRSQ
jgi:hypothetical protein